MKVQIVPLKVIIAKAGTVLDLGATAVPRRVRISRFWKKTPEEQVMDDWSVVAADFNHGRPWYWSTLPIRARHLDYSR